MSGARPDTWMPWYIGDYLRKTMHLDAEEDGAYRRLIDATWVRGGVLLATDKEMAAITKLPIKRWLAIKPTIAAFFEIAEDGWRSDRVSEELAKAEANYSARSAGGKRTAEKRWSNSQPNSSNDAEQVAELPLSDKQSGRPSPSPSPSSSSSNSHSQRARRASAAEQGFEKWYAAFPRHDDPGHAAAAFLKAIKIASLEELIAGAQRYAETVDRRENGRFIALPATWLNGQRWRDQGAGSGPSDGSTCTGNGVSQRRRPQSPPPVDEESVRIAAGIHGS